MVLYVDSDSMFNEINTSMRISSSYEINDDSPKLILKKPMSITSTKKLIKNKQLIFNINKNGDIEHTLNKKNNTLKHYKIYHKTNNLTIKTNINKKSLNKESLNKESLNDASFNNCNISVCGNMDNINLNLINSNNTKAKSIIQKKQVIDII
jgi:hypothetical protein